MDINAFESMNEDALELLKKSPASQLDIYYVRQGVHSMRNELQKIADKIDQVKTHQEEVPANCPAIKLKSELNEYQKSIKELADKVEKNSMIMARNGTKEKKLRPANEVIPELHEAIYWMKGFGLFMTALGDFVRNNKILSLVIFILMLTFQEPLLKLSVAILSAPGSWGNEIIEVLDNKHKAVAMDSVKTDTLKNKVRYAK